MSQAEFVKAYLDLQSVKENSSMDTYSQRVDAEFLFDLLCASASKENLLVKNSDSEDGVEVSLHLLVMRIMSLGEQALQDFRQVFLSNYASTKAAALSVNEAEDGADAENITQEQFEELFVKLRQANQTKVTRPASSRRKATSDKDKGGLGAERRQSQSSLRPRKEVDGLDSPQRSVSTVSGSSSFTGNEAVSKEIATKMFQCIDIDGNGFMSAAELQQAFTEASQEVGFSTMRRRMLLVSGSFRDFLKDIGMELCKPDSPQDQDVETTEQSDMSRSPSPVIIEAMARRRKSVVPPREDENDQQTKLALQAEKICELLEVRTSGAHTFMEHVGLTPDSEEDEVELPDDGTGYTLEEFAIVLFLCKPLDTTLQDMVADLSSLDRDRFISFNDFKEHVIARGTRRPPPHKDSIKIKLNDTAEAAPKAPPLALSPGLIPARCSLKELRFVYDAIAREHGHVSVNRFIVSMPNISDVLAIDRRSYQAGDRIVCRTRLSDEASRLCGKQPVLAVVPERLEWVEEGFRSHWQLDGKRIKSFSQITNPVYELPVGPDGSVLPESCTWITVPTVVQENPRFEVRLLASENGKTPERQVGGGVSVLLTMPGPEAPAVISASVEEGQTSASAVLHWSPPLLADPPIASYVLHVEPLIHKRISLLASARSEAMMLSGAGQEDEDEEEAEEEEGIAASSDGDVGRQASEAEPEDVFDTAVVWDRELRGLSKRLSYKVKNLQPGVPYRFALQCTHLLHDEEDELKEVVGAISELSTSMIMPRCKELPELGQPQVRVYSGFGQKISKEIHELLIPWCETSTPDRHLAYDIQYSFVDGEDEKSDLVWMPLRASRTFTSQKAEYDIDLQQMVLSCLIFDLESLSPHKGSKPHRVRVRTSNMDTTSDWTEASDMFLLADNRLQKHRGARSSLTMARGTLAGTAIAMMISDLQVLQVFSALPEKGSKKATRRSHCHLRWVLPKVEGEISFEVQVREMHKSERDRLAAQSGYWHNLQVFYREEEEENAESMKEAQVIASGLERFSAAARLSLRVLVTSASAGRGVSKEVIIEPATLEPAEPKAPTVVRMLTTDDGWPVAELSWPAPEQLLDAASYAVEAAWAEEGQSEDSLTAWDAIAEATCQPEHAGNKAKMSCFAALHRPARAPNAGICYLRVRLRTDTGGLASPEATPVDVQEFLRSAAAARSAAALQKPSKKAPRRPQHLTINSVDGGWCQVTWEQKGVLSAGQFYEAEVCFCLPELVGGTSSETQDWQAASSLFLSQSPREANDGEQGSASIVRSVGAAIYFGELESVDKRLCWRLRVRVAGGDWSSPSDWQEPPTMETVPTQPCAPEVVSNEVRNYILEWEASAGSSPSECLRYEVEVQGTRGDGRGRSGAWQLVPAFFRTLKASQGGQGHKALIQAVIDRATSAQLVKASAAKAKVTTGFDKLRFRVRSINLQGAASLPSEPSEPTGVMLKTPAASEPPVPEVLGRGYLVLEDNSKRHLPPSEMIQLCWPQPEQESAELPTEYQLQYLYGEAWADATHAMVITDEATRLATAFVPFEGGSKEESGSPRNSMQDDRSWQTARDVKFRLCATRGASTSMALACQPLYSQSTAAVPSGWHALPCDPPTIFSTTQEVLRINFHMDSLAKHDRHCLLFACVEVQRPVAATPPEEERPCEEPADPSERNDPDFTSLGIFPVFWQPALELVAMLASDGSVGEDTDAFVHKVSEGLAVSEAQGNTKKDLTLCSMMLGVIPLPPGRLQADATLRLRLQLDGSSNCEACTAWSPTFVTAGSADDGQMTRPLSAWSESERQGLLQRPTYVLRLEYPGWPCVLPIHSQKPLSLKPRLVAASAAGTLLELLHEKKGTCSEEAPSLHFEVVSGKMPKGLKLDSNLGTITGRIPRKSKKDKDEQEDEDDSSGANEFVQNFVVQVSLLEAWQAFEDVMLPAEAGASTPLAVVAAPTKQCNGAPEAWNLLGKVIAGPLLKVLYKEGVQALHAAAYLLSNDEQLETFARLCVALSGDAGEFTIEIISRILLLPTHYLEVAAEMEEADFVNLLCDAIGDMPSDDEEEGEEEEEEDDPFVEEESGSEAWSGSEAEDESETDKFEEAKDDDETIVFDLKALKRPSNDSNLSKDSGSKGSKRDSMQDRRQKTRSSDVDAEGATVQRGPRGRASVFARGGGIDPRRASVFSRGGGFDRGGFGRMSVIHQKRSSFLGMAAVEEKARPPRTEVEISYPTMVPMWAAFEEHEFTPSINEIDSQGRISPGSCDSPRRASSPTGSRGHPVSVAKSLIPLEVPTLPTPTDDDGADTKGGGIRFQHDSEEESERPSPDTDDPDTEPTKKGNNAASTESRGSFQTRSRGRLSLKGGAISFAAEPDKQDLLSRIDGVKSQEPPNSPVSLLARIDGVKSQATSAPPAGGVPQLKFSVTPALPAQVSINESTGVISGCPLMEHVAGQQYMVTAALEASGEIVGRCAVTFAIVPASVARLCNSAFVGQALPLDLDVSRAAAADISKASTAHNAREDTGYPMAQKWPPSFGISHDADQSTSGMDLRPEGSTSFDPSSWGFASTDSSCSRPWSTSSCSATGRRTRPWQTAQEATRDTGLCGSFSPNVSVDLSQKSRFKVMALGPSLKERHGKQEIRLPPSKFSQTPRGEGAFLPILTMAATH
eukprot:TRINITY_DN5388_c0_g1_i1.p1 TRINITY_DN5388_c0_g1~~TRINITY_DN5388_c0_g1_i1.p1  ORF type:complete len:2831 (-),score=625.54 TRINITY_DN5388_c0_g1_i1:33-7991(-)